MAPIRRGDGTTIAPKGISEVRKGDGTVIWQADVIPDSAIAQYNAQQLSSYSDGDSVSTWYDETSNGFDVTAGGAPTLQTDGINGYDSVFFDGSDDILDTLFDSAYGQRIVVIAVTELAGTAGDDHTIVAGYNNRLGLREQPKNSRFVVDAGSSLTGGSTNTNPTLITAIFDGSNSALRIDGTEAASGDAGTNDLDGITIGDLGHTSGYYYNGLIGFIEPHDGDPSNGLQTREQEVADMWGITI